MADKLIQSHQELPRESLKQARRWVIKVGSSLLTDAVAGVNEQFINHLVEEIVALRETGAEVVVVSSGSIVEGMQRLGWAKRPHQIHKLQSAAAVGQMGLVQHYESAFNKHNIHTALILLSHADLANRTRYLNARSTLQTLLNLGVVPIINENDTVVTDEIRFGDNDTLGALVANLVDADLLVLLTDQDGLCDKDPGQHSDAKLISEGIAGDPALAMLAGKPSEFGTGGMITKLLAAEKAARSDTRTVIANGNTANIISKLRSGKKSGTLLQPSERRIVARKQWLAGLQKPKGSLILDQGAVDVLLKQGRSLLPVGVTAVAGAFLRGDMVVCLSPEGQEIAQGLVNYGAIDAEKILGCASSEIEEKLGFIEGPELIHRDNLVIL